jgi:WD40 repeat protein
MPSIDVWAAERLSLRVRYHLDEAVTALKVSQGNGVVYAASAAGQIVAVDGITPEFLWRKRIHSCGVLAIEPLDRFSLIASGGEDGDLAIVDGNSGDEQTRRSFNRDDGRIAWVNHLSWSFDKSVLAVACGKKVHQFSKCLEPVGAPIQQPTTISSLGWSNRGDQFALSCFGGASRFSALESTLLGECREKEAIVSIAWSPRDSIIACGCHDSAVIIWDIGTGENLKMSGYPGKVLNLAWDSIGRFLVTSGENRLIIWDFIGSGPSGKPPLLREAHEAIISGIEPHPKGRYFCTGSEDGVVIIWRTGDFEPIRIGRADAPVTWLRWMKNGRGVLSGHQDGSLVCWDI